MTELSLAFPLKPHETATSYVSRLTRFVGHQDCHDLCTDLGMHWPSVVRGDADQLARLAQVGGISYRRLCHSAIRARGRLKFRFCGEDVIHKSLVRSRLRVCPHCVLEDLADGGFEGVYRRNYWQFASIRTCQQHNVQLVELPAQKHTIDNYDIVNLVERYQHEIDAAAKLRHHMPFTSFEAYLLARLQQRGDLPFLDGFKLHVAAKLCELLGAALLFDHSPNLRQLTTAQMQQAGERGFSRVRDGEVAFCNALCELREDCDPELSRHRADLGVLYDWLQRTPDNADIRPVKDIVRRHLFATYPIAAGQKVLGATCPETQNYTTRSACREFRRSRSVIGRMAQRARLATMDRKTGTYQLKSSIRRHRMKAMLARADEFLAPGPARVILGVLRYDFDRLVKAGMITVCDNRIEPDKKYNETQIRALRDSLIEHTERATKSDQPLISIRQATTTKRKRFAIIIAMIAEGHLKGSIWADPTQGIYTIQINKQALMDAIASWPPFGYRNPYAQRS